MKWEANNSVLLKKINSTEPLNILEEGCMGFSKGQTRFFERCEPVWDEHKFFGRMNIRIYLLP